MSVLDRKLRRELWAAKGVLAAIVSIIVVGVSSFVTMASAYNNLEQSRRNYYAQCRMADFSIELKKLPLAELDRIAAIPGITELRPRIIFNARVDLAGVDQPISGQVVSLPAEPTPIINNVIVRQGNYFTDRRTEEVIVNESFAKKRNIRPGDRIHLILNNRRQELFVVGTAISSEFVYLLAPGGFIPDPESYGLFYIKDRFAEEVFDFQGACNQVVGLLAPRYRDRPEAILDRIETVLEPYGVAGTTPLSSQASHFFLTSEIIGLRVSAVILPGIFLAVAALILNVLMTRRAEQQRTVVGTLKALGYTDREVFVHFLKFGVTVGLIGGLLGAAIGYVQAELMMIVYRQYFEFPRLINRPYPAAIGAGVAISVVFSVLGTLRGVRAVVRLKPAEAMRPKPPPTARNIALERWRWFWRRLDFRWHMVLRGLFRNRMRTLAGVVASAVGCSLLLVTFSMRDAMNEMVAFQFDKLLQSDFDLSFQDERDMSALFEARRLPGVDAAEPVFAVPCTFSFGHRSKQSAITGLLPPARLTAPRDLEGRKVTVPEVGLLMTKKLAEILAVSPGDMVTMEPAQGIRDPSHVPVTRIVDSYLGMAAYADFHYLNRLVGEEESLNLLQLKVAPGADQTREFYRELKQLPAVQGVAAIRDQKEKLVELLVEQMLVTIFIVILFAGLIFFGSILNSSLISLAERKQEIGMLRALGYTPREVGAVFLRESVIVNSVGIFAGLPLGYWLSRGLVQLYDTELFRMPFVLHTSSYVVSLLFGLMFILISHGPVQRTINKLNWREALNVKE